jgi:hypothetical protein
MKLITRLGFAGAAIGMILALGVLASDKRPTVSANPFKANLQQFERFEVPVIVAKGSK